VEGTVKLEKYGMQDFFKIIVFHAQKHIAKSDKLEYPANRF